jgi:hypothetical protein
MLVEGAIADWSAIFEAGAAKSPALIKLPISQLKGLAPAATPRCAALITWE